jgi:hypothetical protein
MKLMRVIGNHCHLQWPVPPFSEEHRSRGGKGYVVDIDHPCETGYDEPVTNKAGIQQFDNEGQPRMRHVQGWCEGQMHKLEPVPADSGITAATPINLPAALHAKAEYDAARAPKAETPAETEPAPKRKGNYQKPAREPAEVIEGG